MDVQALELANQYMMQAMSALAQMRNMHQQIPRLSAAQQHATRHLADRQEKMLVQALRQSIKFSLKTIWSVGDTPGNDESNSW